MIELSKDALGEALRSVAMDYRLPGNSDSNGFHQGFRLQIVNQYTPIYRSSEIPEWVLGAEILRTVKISINTMDGEKMFQITS